MAQTLKLEYACTPAEMDEAQTLNLRKRVGRGSKWLTRVVLLLILVGMLLGLYFRMNQLFSEQQRPFAYGGVVFIIVAFVIWKRMTPKQRPLSKLEISEQEVTFAMAGSKTTMPWGAFAECLESPKLFVLLDRPKRMLFVVPKRVFPGESELEWFRGLAHSRPASADVGVEAADNTEAPGADQVALSFRLGFRDYIDRTLASWKTWGAIIGMLALFVGIGIYSGFQPHPHAVNSPLKVFIILLCIAVPMIPTMVIAILTVSAWSSHAKYLTPQQVWLTEPGMRLVNSDATSLLVWSKFTNFKETKRSFILWNTKGGLWMMLPRRGFKSAHDWEHCREMLSRNLKPSRWFLG